MKIAVVAGHSSAVPGVCRDEFREFDLAREMRDAVVRHLAARQIAGWIPPGDHEPDLYPEYLTQPIREINAARCDAAVELHTNSGPPEASHYTLCLHAPGSERGRQLAERVALEVHLALVPWNAVSPQAASDMAFRKRRAAFVQDTKCPAIIVEPFFLSNARVREFLRTHRAEVIENVARSTAAGIAAWCAIEEHRRRATAEAKPA